MEVRLQLWKLATLALVLRKEDNSARTGYRVGNRMLWCLFSLNCGIGVQAKGEQLLYFSLILESVEEAKRATRNIVRPTCQDLKSPSWFQFRHSQWETHDAHGPTWTRLAQYGAASRQRGIPSEAAEPAPHIESFGPAWPSPYERVG